MSDDRPTLDLPIDVEHPKSFMSLRQEWIAADGGDGIHAQLDCGAGLGSPLMTLTVEREGEVIAREVIDIRGPLGEWIDAAINRADQREEGR